jgi:hypothetical protein
MEVPVKKKIAVLVRDRQTEALRMAVGLTLADDDLSVFVMDNKLDKDEKNSLNIETLRALGVRIYSNNPENRLEYMTTEEIARTLVTFDTVIPY